MIDMLANMYTKYFGHMTKITATTVYGKYSLNYSTPELENK